MKKIYSFLIAMIIVAGVSAQDSKFKPTVQAGGLIQYGFDLGNQKDGTQVDSVTFEDYDLKSQYFRRAFFFLKGNVAPNISYKLQIDFFKSQVFFKDMYVKFHDLPGIGGNLIIGSQYEPTTLDIATVGKYNIFEERAMLTQTQGNRWNSGFGYENYKIFDGRLGLHATFTFNGKNTSGFDMLGNLEGRNIVARMVGQVLKNDEKHHNIHLGVKFEDRKRTKEAADFTQAIRPEIYTAKKVSVLFPKLKYQRDYGFDMYTQWGPLSIQAEYESANYHTEDATYTLTGYYGAVGFFLTGETRGYKNGATTIIKPKKPFNLQEGHWGAFELVARYSVEDYSKVSIAEGICNPAINNITLGFNWFMTNNTRIIYNYLITDYNQPGFDNNLYTNTISVMLYF